MARGSRPSPGHDGRPTDLVITRPWEVQPGCAAEESEDTVRLLDATAAIETPTARGLRVP